MTVSKIEIIGMTAGIADDGTLLNGIVVPAVAAKTTKKGLPTEQMKFIANMKLTEISSYVQKVALGKDLSGHHIGILEHMSITIAIERISRLAVEYLEHHRIASYCEQSFRVRGNTLKGHPECVVFDDAFHFYQEMIYPDESFFTKKTPPIKEEDARYILPYGTLTSMVMTANISSWRNIIRHLKGANLFEVYEIGEIIEHEFKRYAFGELLGKLPPQQGWSPYTQINVDVNKQTKWGIYRVDLIGTDNDTISVGNPRFGEGLIYRVEGYLSGVAYAQLKRHRIGTLWVSPLHEGDLSREGCFAHSDKLYKKGKMFLEAARQTKDVYNIPLGIERKFMWIVNERSLTNFLKQRLDHHAQMEIRHLAQFIAHNFDDRFKHCFPVTKKDLTPKITINHSSDVQ